MIPDPLLRFRPEFPILEKTTFLIFSLGAMPRRATERLREYAETWMSHGVRAWAKLERAFEAIEEVQATGAWERWRGQPALVT